MTLSSETNTLIFIINSAGYIDFFLSNFFLIFKKGNIYNIKRKGIISLFFGCEEIWLKSICKFKRPVL